MAFLRRRRGLLDAVVFSGGEPTLQTRLLGAVRDVKALGFQVGLHTAGAYPARLERVLPLLDWVGMDIKAPFGQYEQLTGVPGSGVRALRSARLLLESGVAHEFRTTVDALLCEGNALIVLGQSLAALGVKRYVLQECRRADRQGAPNQIPHPLIPKVGELFDHFDVRQTT
jgi:pyruvate formate lyase activating enzyme